MNFSAYKNAIITITFLVCSLSLTSCGPEVSFDISTSKLFADANVTTTASFLRQSEDCKPTKLSGTKEFESSKIKFLRIFDPASNPKITNCVNKDGSIDMASIWVNAEIVSFNSDADLSIQRQQFPEISVDEQTYDVRAVKISFGRAFLDRAKRELNESSDLNKNALGDPTVKVAFVNDDNQDVILTGYNLWLNEQPIDVLYQKKVVPLEKVELKFSQVTGQLVGRGDAPIVFFVGKQK